MQANKKHWHLSDITLWYKVFIGNILWKFVIFKLNNLPKNLTFKSPRNVQFFDLHLSVISPHKLNAVEIKENYLERKQWHSNSVNICLQREVFFFLCNTSCLDKQN